LIAYKLVFLLNLKFQCEKSAPLVNRFGLEGKTGVLLLDLFVSKVQRIQKCFDKKKYFALAVLGAGHGAM